MKVDLRGIDGHLCSADCGGHEVRMDQPRDYGGGDRAPEPVALLGASLAGCVYSSLVGFLQRRGLRPEQTRVEVEMVKARDPGRIGTFRVGLRLPEGIKEEWLPAVRKLASGCSVHGTFTTPVEVEVEILDS